ncbi:MAG: hypothetical protein KC561_20305, partial [Myxococcales bacterium]|nr:hypothetical protein [Myxococcales bacterium]
LESITAFNDGLLKFEGTIIFASHDLQFVSSLAERVFEFDGDDFYDLMVNYESYLADDARKARRGIVARY